MPKVKFLLSKCNCICDNFRKKNVCVGMLVCAYTHQYVKVKTTGRLRCPLLSGSTSLPWDRPLNKPSSFYHWVSWLSTMPSNQSFCLHPLELREQQNFLAFTWVLWTQLQYSWFYSEHSYPLNHLPSFS